MYVWVCSFQNSLGGPQTKMVDFNSVILPLMKGLHSKNILIKNSKILMARGTWDIMELGSFWLRVEL